jgi:hypothetical protein
MNLDFNILLFGIPEMGEAKLAEEMPRRLFRDL